MRRRIYQVVSVSILTAGLVAALLLCRRLIDTEMQELRVNTDTAAKNVAVQLRAGIVDSADGLNHLARWWGTQGKPADLEDWRSDGQLFLARSPGLQRAIWIGRDGLQHWSAAPGSDPDTGVIHPTAQLRRLVTAARSTRQMAVSEIFEGPGRHSQFYLCLPVDGAKGGFVAGLFDAETLISSIASRRVPSNLRIAVRTRDREVYSQFAAHSASSGEVAAGFELGATQWTVSIAVPQRHFTWFTGQIVAIVCVIAALLYAFAVLLYMSHNRSSELERVNTEIRELNRDLNRKMADFQTLLDVIPIGIAVAHDSECREISVNPALAALSGVTRDTNISKSGPGGASLPYRVMRDGKELQPYELPMQLAAATGTTVKAEEYQIVRADGRVFDVLAFASPVFDENGRVRGVLNACVDISERKAEERLRANLERRLYRDERMKSLGIMAAGIAHDFNNLLTTIIGQGYLAIDALPRQSEAFGHISASVEAAHRAAAVVRRVMAYTGRSHHSVRPMDLQPILTSCATICPTLRLNLPSEIPAILADPDEIRQAIQNVLSNAVEAAEDAEVEMEVDTCVLSGNEPELLPQDQKLSPGHYVRVNVKDRGVGMASEIADHAFDPFFSTKFLGRGLGLSQVLGIMRSHRGAVRLRSTPNSGTSVELFLPVRKSA